MNTAKNREPSNNLKLEMQFDKESGHWVYSELPVYKQKLERRERRQDIIVGIVDTVAFSAMCGIKNLLTASLTAGVVRGVVDNNALHGMVQFGNTCRETFWMAAGISALTYGISYIRNHAHIKQENSLLMKAKKTQDPIDCAMALQHYNVIPKIEKQTKRFAFWSAMLTAGLTFQHNKPPEPKKADDNKPHSKMWDMPAAPTQKTNSATTYAFR